MASSWIRRTVLAALLTATTACGTTPATEDGGVATIASSAVGAETPTETTIDPEEAFARFQECMEEYGIDMPAPDDEGGIEVRRESSVQGEESQDGITVNGGALDVSPEVFEAAQEACRQYLEDAVQPIELTPEQEAALDDANLAFQECMEEHGVEGSFSIGVAGGAGGVAIERAELDTDPQQPDPGASDEVDPEVLDAAHEECRKVFEETPELEGLFGPDEE
jgi:hypothetical protein